VRGALRRMGDVSLRELVSGSLLAGAGRDGRRTVGTGSNLAPFFPGSPAFSRAGMPAPHSFVPKLTATSLRRFSETPVARRAINTIKDRIAGMRWRIQPRSGRSLEQMPDGALRAQILTENFEAPNPDDSFRSLLEQVLEDVIVGGYGAIEIDLVEGWAGSANWLGRRDAVPTAGGAPALPGPLLLWPVDGATIRIMTDWDGRPDSPRYVQVTPRSGPEAQIVLNDDELSYIRLNARTHTPFGLGRLEVAFETINSFLSAHRYASRLASNSVVQYALWLQDLGPAQHERLIRWWQDEIEGTGRVPILSVESKPEVLRFGAGTDADLRLAWQEFLLRVIADAFDLPAQFLGVERDVNRSTAAEMTDMAFRSAIVPTARLVAEHLTRDAIGKKLGWTDLEFVFTDVDASDEMEQAQIDEILLRNGVVTVNEVRRARGLGEIV
jgi:phage portal protein BeeE